MENSNNSDYLDKKQKSELIESMLSEVGMSKQELIDLLTGVVEIEQSHSIEVSSGKVSVKSQEFQTLDNSQDLSDLLSLQEVQSLINKVDVAKSYLQAQKLGFTLDEDVAEMIGLENPKKASFKSFVSALKKLSDDQIDKLKKLIDEQAKKLESKKSEKSSGLAKFIGAVKTGFEKGQKKLKDTIHSIDYKEDIARLKETSEQVEASNGKLKKFESFIKERFPKIKSLKYSKSGVFVSVEGLSTAVNLKEFLKSQGELTPSIEKMIDDASGTASAMKKGLEILKEALGNDIDDLGFDKNGKLNVEKQVQGMKQKIHINDYLGDMDRVTLERARLKDKSDDDIQAKKDFELGELELESEGQEEGKGNKTQITAKKESKQTKDSLVKLDVIADKANLVEAQNLMKEGMKDMKEAMKNKDLVENMRKDMQKNREK